VIVLTELYNALPVEGGCVRLVGGWPHLTEGSCAGRYLVVERGRGVRASSAAVGGGPLVFFVAAGGPPMRFVLSEGAVRAVGDGLELFSGFVKRGLWRELEPAFFAAVARYGARCSYCTAYMEVAGRASPARRAGLIVSVGTAGGVRRVVVVSAPGHSEDFKRAVLEAYRSARAIYAFGLGVPVDVALDVYMPPRARPTAEVAPLLPIPAARPLA